MISDELKGRLACQPGFVLCLEAASIRVVDYMGAVFIGWCPTGGVIEWAQLGQDGARSLIQSLTYRTERAALYDPAGDEPAEVVLEKARETYRRWYRGLDTADCGPEAAFFEEALDELRTNPERLADVLARTVEYLEPANADATPEFLVLRMKALRAGFEETEPFNNPLLAGETAGGAHDVM